MSAAVRDAGAAVSALEKWDDAAQLRARLVELAGVIDCSGWAISLSKGQAVVTGPEGQSYAATPDPKNIASAVLFDFALSVAFDRDNTHSNYERVCAELDLARQPQWKPFDEPPPPDTAVLAYYHDGVHGASGAIEQTEHDGDRWLHSTLHDFGYHVTHWMPLPSPPKVRP